MYFFNDFKIHLVLKILHKTLPHVNVIAHQIFKESTALYLSSCYKAPSENVYSYILYTYMYM